MAGNLLHYADYIIVVLVLVISLAIGISISYVSGRNKAASTGEYLLGSRQMGLVPVVISLTVSFVSAVTMLGFATETYFYGITFMMILFAQTIAAIGASVTFIPLFYPLNITSGNQYLLMRFKSKSVALFGVITQLLMMYALSGVFMVGPAFMFEAVSGCPVWASLIILGVCGTFYTSIGGYKAVIWTDVFQSCVMIIAQIAILAQGTISVGGVSKVMQTYRNAGGFEMKWKLDPLGPYDFWTVVLVMSFTWYIMLGSVQISVQRYLSLPNLTKSIIGVLGVIPGIAVFTSLSSFCGIVAYAYYVHIGCDPFSGGKIQNINQILPVFVVDVLEYPGLAGIFVAGVFCGSLSSYSTTISALGAFTWADLLEPHLKQATPEKQTLVTRSLSVINGCVSLGVSFLFSALSSSLVSLIVAVATTLLTPLAVIFIQGATFPRINWKSALVSAVATGILFMTCCIGNTLQNKHAQFLPLSTANCTRMDAVNVTSVLGNVDMAYNLTYDSHFSTTTPNTSIPSQTSRPISDYFFKLNTSWYMPIGMLIGCIIGLLVSLIPGFYEEDPVPAEYLFPHVRWILGRKNYEGYHLGEDDEKKNEAETKNADLENNDPLHHEARVTKLYRPKSGSGEDKLDGTS